ncbi:MAG: DUF1622 domain-containing protein, partial [Vicinamibacterales bacterium]
KAPAGRGRFCLAPGSASDMEEVFVRVAEIAERFSEAAAVIVVTFGSLEAFLKLLWIGVTPSATHGERKAVWRRFGLWLLLGLEFELAADIIGSVVSPTWQEVGKLGAIAVIRTFLNYFLEQDLDSAEASGESAGQRE